MPADPSALSPPASLRPSSPSASRSSGPSVPEATPADSTQGTAAPQTSASTASTASTAAPHSITRASARWVTEPFDAEASRALQQQLRIHPILCRLLVQRGIEDFESARRFFRPSLDDLHDPLSPEAGMAGMPEALDRLDRALQNGEHIRIYGDYDVDGTTAVALVYGFFRQQHRGRIDYYIPDRYTEGYGLSERGIQHAITAGVDLLVTVDCGIKATARIAEARAAGMDVIVCDHHLPPAELPPANAILDPKRADCPYPYTELCGCGIGLKLVQAWCQRHGRPDAEWQAYLDLVAVAIAADIVPMTGENRILAVHGMQRLEQTPRPGLKALMDVAGIKAAISTRDLGFGLGPRINAAGRMGHGHDAVQLLLAEPGDEALKAADGLHQQNEDRKHQDRSITQEALAQMAAWPDLDRRVSTVVHAPHWHKGVVGIVASRLIECVHRPTVVLTRDASGGWTGSARSVPGFDLHEAIAACGDLLDRFGGHTHAAGLSLSDKNLPAFRERFEDAVRKRIRPEHLEPELRIAADLPLHEVQPGFYKILRQFAPFGPGNAAPVFRAGPVQDTGRSRCVGRDHSHLKLEVQSAPGSGLPRAYGSGIAFGRGAEWTDLCRHPLELAFELEENTWQGKTRLQLQVKDLRAAAR